jgi:trehalose 6-phosphate phosphatase
MELAVVEETNTTAPTNVYLVRNFLEEVASSRQAALLLDFDGTLAPFRIDRFNSRPWAGVVQLLDEIQREGRTRLALVTGRPAREASLLLGLTSTLEVWGLHGVERLYPNGRLETDELLPSEVAALNGARNAIASAQLGLLIEEKRNAVVVHWRGIPRRMIAGARERSVDLLRPFAEGGRMQMLLFDGGVELRAGRHKGDAVREVLTELPEQSPVAYLGDDTTDEDAFRALEGRGLGVLVRKTKRPSAAQVWLRPPGQLRDFLRGWLGAVRS